jgi:hypothetical protein
MDPLPFTLQWLNRKVHVFHPEKKRKKVYRITLGAIKKGVVTIYLFFAAWAWAGAQMPTVGDRVEGRYGDGPDWFAGTIQSQIGPGVFSIAYEDGA